MAPPVTVVTSTYNWPSALNEAIRTALAQTFTDFEYLIVGDGCTDETESVVRAFDDPRIVWRNLPQNLGNQADVNRLALEWARGKFIAYLNHDDLWFPDHLETLLPALRDNALDIVNSLCLAISPPGHNHRQLLGLPVDSGAGRREPVAMTTTVMHTAEAARAVGSWTPWRETSKVPTQDFFARLRDLGAFGVLPHVTALKFHSADRRNSYQLKDAAEQAAWAKRIATDPKLRYRETMTALAYDSMLEPPPQLPHPRRPNVEPPGWQVEQWRRMRGLPPMLDLGDTATPSNAGLPEPGPSHVRVDEKGGSLIALSFAPGMWPL